MTALILDGTAGGQPAAAAVRDAVGDRLGDDWQVESIPLRQTEIAPCTGCFGCWVRSPGECVIDDAGREVARRVVRSRLLVFLTPVTFGGYAWHLKKAVDRLLPLVLPLFTKIRGETHHKRRYARYPHLVGVGLLDRADLDAQAVFERLVARNALNFHCPSHAAGVVLGDDAPQTVRRKVYDLLGEAGVAS